jgi:putative transposase
MANQTSRQISFEEGNASTCLKGLFYNIRVGRLARPAEVQRDVVRVSEATIYNWKAKYGGLEVSEAKRLRALEDENAKLKRLLAEAMLDNAGLKDLLAKNW